MKLEHFIRFGYALLIITVLLMVWTSCTGAREVQSVRYPPCYFNPLCSCSKVVPDLGIVQCQDVHLPMIPQTINSSKVFMLNLENNGLRTLVPFFLQNTGLYKLSIKHNPLPIIPDEALVGLEWSLWELVLSNNELINVPSKAFRYLQKLRLLDLTGNDISEIKSDSWRGLEKSLDTLILADNSIASLPTDAFSGLPHLDTINLEGNNLREIDPSVFRDGMDSLAHINLGHNQLSSIPYQALAPLKKLRSLDLSYNRVTQMKLESDEVLNPQFIVKMSLDLLRLDYNEISILKSSSFQHFVTVNKTYLDGNPLINLQENAFRSAQIRELYIRNCGLTEVFPASFDGLEDCLQILDLSGNNLKTLHETMFHRFDILHTLSLRDNFFIDFNPTEIFHGFQHTLFNLDYSGEDNAPISLQELRRLRSLRVLSLSRLRQPVLDPEDFVEYGIDLEELHITFGGLQAIMNHAFIHVHSLKKLDLSDNEIGLIEFDAFENIGHSLLSLRLAHAFDSSMSVLPVQPLRTLINLQELDLSSNRIISLPDISFHFLKKLRKLELQDNAIDHIQKGTFQGDIHSNLELIYLSFNNIDLIELHTFTGLALLQQLHLDDNKIDTLERRAFMNLNNLKRLNLKGNKISAISFETFQNLPELEDLDISYNKLQSFEFSMFDQVGTLSTFCVNASHNMITNLLINTNLNLVREGGNGGFHSNIKILDLSFNNITFVDKQYFLPVEMSLTHLYLSHNFILNATKEVFGKMPQLRLLDFSHNRIFEIDYDTFRNTRNVQIMIASHNYISDVPKDLFRHLTNLRIVDLSHNKLRFLPDNLFSDQEIEQLDLSNNQLTRLPVSSFSIVAARTLSELDMSWNGISAISQNGWFSNFKTLSVLDLSHNRLVQLDHPAFSPLSHLSSLDLSHNTQLVLERSDRTFEGIEDSLLHLGLDNVSLTYVPDLPLPNLLTLSLSYNSLPSIPPELAINVSSLRRLNLAYNDLTAVPVAIHYLPQLQYLSLEANPITIFSNISLSGANNVVELDMCNLPLNVFEWDALSNMHSLRDLKISPFDKVNNFNIPRILEDNEALQSLEIHVEKDFIFTNEMQGIFPPSLNNITISGLGFKQLKSDILQGVRNPHLYFALHNTSISKISRDLFKNLDYVRNISIDVRDNDKLQSFENPSSGSKPGLPRRTFLTDLWISGNKWSCDCTIGWIEIWQRKKRQYLCGLSPSRPPPYRSEEYWCRHIQDDIRNSYCSNKANQSVVEILKTELECGWSSASLNHGFAITFILIVVGLLQLRNCEYN